MSTPVFGPYRGGWRSRCRRSERSDAVRRHPPGAGPSAPAPTLTVAPADSGQVTLTGLHHHDPHHRHDLHHSVKIL
jgi:hypothetical protein